MSKSQSDINRVYELVTTFIKSNIFRSPIKNFVDEYCINFDGSEENSFEFTSIHNNFKNLIESLLLKLLEEIGVDQELFLLAAKKGLESDDKKFYEQLIACDNFLYFKNMMVKRNMQLEEEAMKLMQSKNVEKNLNLSGPELEFYKQRKYEKEMECAIQMSLALEEEKKRLLALEEEELRKALELSRIANKDNPDWNEEKELSLFGTRAAQGVHSGNYYVGSYVTDIHGIQLGQKGSGNDVGRKSNGTGIDAKTSGASSGNENDLKNLKDISNINIGNTSKNFNNNIDGKNSSSLNNSEKPNNLSNDNLSSKTTNEISGININVKSENPNSNTINFPIPEGSGANNSYYLNKKGDKERDINISIYLNQGKDASLNINQPISANTTYLNDNNNPNNNVWKTSLNKAGMIDLSIPGTANSANTKDDPKNTISNVDKTIELTENLTFSGTNKNPKEQNKITNNKEDVNSNNKNVTHDKNGNPIASINNNYVYDKNGNPIIGTVSNNTLFDKYGNIVGTINNGLIYDKNGNIIGTLGDANCKNPQNKDINSVASIDDNIFYDKSGNPIIGTINNNNLLDKNGNIIGTITNGFIYDKNGNIIGKMADAYSKKSQNKLSSMNSLTNSTSSGSVIFSQSVISENVLTGNKSLNSSQSLKETNSNNLISMNSTNGLPGANLTGSLAGMDKATLEKMMQINYDLPDLSGVKSKIDTGLRRNKEVVKEHSNDELNKKYNQIQKENQDKLKDYRDMILKMKQEKRNLNNKEEPKKKKVGKK